MDPTLAKTLFLVGTTIFCVLGVAHGFLTLRDLRTPRSFTPTDERVRRAMAEAPLRFAPQTTIWSAWLGFNLSHSLGLLVFGLLLGGVALHDFRFVAGNLFLQSISVSVALVYALLAVRFWFWVPAVASALGGVCFLVSALSV